MVSPPAGQPQPIHRLTRYAQQMSATLLLPATSNYTELLARVKAAGLLKKKPSFYIIRLAVISVASTSLWSAGALLAVSQIPEPAVIAIAFVIAGGLGVLGAQYGFIAHEAAPCASMSFAEVIATSDVPGGVVNILTGSPSELLPWLSSHADVNAIDLSGIAGELAVECERSAAETLMRVTRPGRFAASQPSFDRIGAFVETKTVWHTKSLA